MNPLTSPSKLLRCPLCEAAFEPQDRTLRCANNHCFDRAKQGYFNLLPVQNKRSLSPGDNREMVHSRAAFLDQGHYQPIADQLIRLALSHTPSSEINGLDVGCGEGYYSDQLEQALRTANNCASDFIGLDISKDAVRNACRRNKHISWIVASGAKVPIADHQLDLLTCLFSPLSSEEFHRLLKPRGRLLIASTGPKHLIELRETIYPQVKTESLDPTKPLDKLFSLEEQIDINFSFKLNSNEEISQLLSMTPHQWRASTAARERLSTIEQMRLTADIRLWVLYPVQQSAAEQQPVQH